MTGKNVPSTSAVATHAIAELRDLQVLVVEDSWHVASALKALLEELEVKVAGPAATPAEAKRLLTERKPDVAIVDINLKGEMAYELIDSLNERGVRVVVISGYAIPQVAQSKVAAVLQKPFSAKALLAILRQTRAASEEP
jgi:CheY-like chemotaxis protein